MLSNLRGINKYLVCCLSLSFFSCTGSMPVESEEVRRLPAPTTVTEPEEVAEIPDKYLTCSEIYSEPEIENNDSNYFYPNIEFSTDVTSFKDADYLAFSFDYGREVTVTEIRLENSCANNCGFELFSNTGMGEKVTFTVDYRYSNSEQSMSPYSQLDITGPVEIEYKTQTHGVTKLKISDNSGLYYFAGSLTSSDGNYYLEDEFTATNVSIGDLLDFRSHDCGCISSFDLDIGLSPNIESVATGDTARRVMNGHLYEIRNVATRRRSQPQRIVVCSGAIPAESIELVIHRIN